MTVTPAHILALKQAAGAGEYLHDPPGTTSEPQNAPGDRAPTGIATRRRPCGPLSATPTLIKATSSSTATTPRTVRLLTASMLPPFHPLPACGWRPPERRRRVRSTAVPTRSSGKRGLLLGERLPGDPAQLLVGAEVVDLSSVRPVGAHGVDEPVVVPAGAGSAIDLGKERDPTLVR